MDAATLNGPAVVDSGRSFMEGASGVWAGQKMMACIKEGRILSPKELRTLDILSKDEWKTFDTALVEEGRIRLRGVADLIAAGNVRRIPNGLAKTVLEYQKITDMDPAIVSLDGVTRSENDRVQFLTAGLPLPLTHKDFYINLRTLLASRTTGEPLDTTYVRLAGRKVAEETERMLFQGGKVFLGLTIYGYTNHPNRNTLSFGTNGSWSAVAKTGADILADLNGAISLLEGDRFYGPYVVYVGSAMSNKLGEDFKAASDKNIRTRLLDDNRIKDIRVVDQLPANTVIVVQLTPDVVEMVEGERLQTVQWDVHGGFQINFKAFQIMVPLIRADAQGRSGVVHIS
jgi:uncharacterized linocin/CFP29 family protein